MNEKITSTIVLTIIILTAIGGLYFVYNSTIGKTYEGTQAYVEALYERDIMEKALTLNKKDAIDKLYYSLPACVTYGHTYGTDEELMAGNLQQKYITTSYEARGFESMTKLDTWRIVDVSSGQCKPIGQIFKMEKPARIIWKSTT